MKEGNEVQRPEQKMSHGMAPLPEDQMSPLDLWCMLLRWKKLVLGVALLTLIAVVAKSFFYPPVIMYKIETVLSQPSASDIQMLNLTPKKAFDVFVRNLESRSLRLRYFNENNLLGKFAPDHSATAGQVFEESFNKALSVFRNGEKVVVSASYSGPNAKSLADSLNGFVAQVNEETVRDLVKDYNNAREGKLAPIRGEIATERIKLKHRREARIAALEEAADIAERLGIREVPKAFIWGGPLYTRGTKMLLAEAEVLRARKSEDPLSPVLRGLQAELIKLEFRESDGSHISAMQIVQAATIPGRLVNKPENILIVALTGLLGGLALGVLAAFFADLTARARAREAVQSGREMV